MTYLVKAPLVLVKVPGFGDDYRVDYHYAGSTIPWLSAEQEKRFLDENLVEKVDGGTDSAVDPADGKPLRAAPKADWVDYAMSQHGADHTEAEALNKQELIDLYG